MSLERIVLAGFMGSGKSTVGRLLATKLGWRFIDLDHEIETHSGKSIPAIFAESGEAHFRQLESNSLQRVLRQNKSVIALGGGAPELEANRTLLSEAVATSVVFLKAPFATLVARCEEQALDPAATARPIFADPVEASRRFDRRHEYYVEIAHHMVETASLNPQETVLHLVERLGLSA